MNSDLRAMINAGESIIWSGKPNKKVYILEGIFNPMLPIALIWGMLDFSLIGLALKGTSGQKNVGLFLLGFFAIHLMPVWMYLGGVITTLIRYRNTEYMITDKGIYVSGGSFTKTYEMKPFTDLSHINIHRGIFDQWMGVGDVVSACSHVSHSGSSSHAGHRGITICDIEDYQRVFNLVKQLQTDIYSDTMYPNAKRPEYNPGYQTQYNPTNPIEGYNSYPNGYNDTYHDYNNRR